MKKRSRLSSTSRRQRLARRRGFESLEDRRLLAANLVSDLVNTNASDSPTESATIGDVAIFANADTYGNELWISDGSNAGTMRFLDINEGVASSDPRNFLPFAGGLVFEAETFDASTGEGGPRTAIWYTDGTVVGTYQLVDDFVPVSKAVVDGDLFFSGEIYTYGVGSGGVALGKVDGTTLGSVIIKNDFESTPMSGEFAAVGDKLFFVHDEGSDGNGDPIGEELWVSDGTLSGTKVVKDIQVGQSYYYDYGSYPQSLTAAGGKLFFTAESDGFGREMWVSDGTVSGTFLLKDIDANNDGYYYFYSSNASDLTASGSLLYFTAFDDDSSPAELWVSDGSTAGTQKLSGVENPYGLLDVNSKLFFAATDTSASNNKGTELWSIDGVTGGIVLVKDINPGTADSSPGDFTNFNGTLLFTADDGINGSELWTSDGTSTGTSLITNLTAGASSSNITPVATTSSHAYFVKNDATTDLWRTDGTAAGTVVVESTIGGTQNGIGTSVAGNTKLFFAELDSPDLFVTSGSTNDKVQLTNNFSSLGSAPTSVTQVGDKIYFVSDAKLYVSDGTDSGTIVLADTLRFPAFTDQDNIIGDLGNGTVLFPGLGPSGFELWKTDGTVAGTSQLKELYSGNTSSSPTNFAVVNGVAFFYARARDGSNNDVNFELWKSDGTEAGTVLVENIHTSSSSLVNKMTVVGNQVYFIARDLPTWQMQLFTSDGTTTEKVTNVADSNSLVNPSSLTSFDDRLFFVQGGKLWVADGNQATNLDSVTSNVSELEIHNNEIYFNGSNDEIWSTTRDGSGNITGTTMVANLNAAGGVNALPQELTAAGNALYFVAHADASLGDDLELWKLESGAASLLKDVFDGTMYSESVDDIPFGLTAFQDKLVFFANDGIHGIEPWVSDGTAAGTKMVYDVLPIPEAGSLDVYGAYSYNNFFPVAMDDQLFFAADDGIHGQEPWRITFPLVAADVASVSGEEGEILTATGTLQFASTITADFGNVVDNTNGTWTWTGSVADGPGTQVLTLTVTDVDGFTSVEMVDLNITNAAPTIELGSPETVPSTANGSFSRSGIAIADAGVLDSQTATIDYGDGSSPVVVNLGPDDDLNLFHNYNTGGVYTITVNVVDSDGGSGSDTLVVTVDPPELNAVDDAVVSTENTNVTISVLPNDSPAGNVGVVGNTQASNGTVADNGDGTFSYTPNTGFTGTDSFDYTIAITDAELVSSTASVGDRLGYSVDVDGDFAVVGAYSDDPGGVTNAGSAFVYQRTQPNSWTQVAQLSGDAVAQSSFGWSVAIDGDTVAVSAQYDGELGFRAGAVYVFGRNEGGSDNWGQVVKLHGDDTVKRDLFGRSVDLSGDEIVVGASTADPLGSASGAAYVFKRDMGGANNWGQVKKLTGSTQAAGDRFGHSVSIDGEHIVVGAFRHDGVGNDSGAAYLFKRDRFGVDNWGELKVLEAPDGAAADNFGTSVAIRGTTVAVGAPLDDEGGVNQLGSVYVYDRNTGGNNNWGQTAKLLADGGSAGDRFGTTVSIDGTRIVAGSPQADGGGDNSGQAYLFEDLGGVWQQTRVLVNEQVTTADQYGIAVAVGGDTAIVGSWLDNRPANNSGGAYAFDLRTDVATVTVTVNPANNELPQFYAPLSSNDSAELVDEVLAAELDWGLF
ncbi:Ig-like domain-containing protein [Rubripirellula amarantea]|nr:Ig-like domain-containing protein [Rubripirellula amarantea]